MVPEANYPYTGMTGVCNYARINGARAPFKLNRSPGYATLPTRVRARSGGRLMAGALPGGWRRPRGRCAAAHLRFLSRRQAARAAAAAGSWPHRG